MDTNCFVHKDEVPSMYKSGTLHRAYIGAIIAIYGKA